MRIMDVPMKCSNCGWRGPVRDCEPDVDGDGSLGCPKCLSVVTENKTHSKKCNCWIGRLNDYDQSDESNLYLNTYVDKLTDKATWSITMNKWDSHYGVCVPGDYLDRRKGLVFLFDYCPLCGVKINWQKIKKVLTNR